MKILHCDCFAGISGDMFLAALVDLGVDESELCRRLEKLNLRGWEIKTRRDSRGGVWGTRLDVLCQENAEAESAHCADSANGAHTHSAAAHSHEHSHDHLHEHSHGRGSQAHSHESGSAAAHHGHRPFSEIKNMISNSSLSEREKSNALKIFSALAAAEAKVHNTNIDDVCFHEVGAVDSIIDIVGASICLELLGVEKLTSSAVELGGGTVRCAHGIMPVPAPATAVLSENFAFTLNGAPHECTTPTGAAIIASLAEKPDIKTQMKTLAVGIGIGHRQCECLPNFLRVCLFETATENQSERDVCTLVELASNIDDMSAEEISLLCETLFSAGALDVWQQPIAMKKGRLAVKVCALCKPENKGQILEAYFKNSSTLGVRCSNVERVALKRNIEIADSKYGKFRVKVSQRCGVKSSKIEFDDLRMIAEKSGKSVSEISREILGEDL